MKSDDEKLQEAFDETNTPLGDIVWEPKRKNRSLIRKLEKHADTKRMLTIGLGIDSSNLDIETLHRRVIKLRSVIYNWRWKSPSVKQRGLIVGTFVRTDHETNEIIMVVYFFSNADIQSAERF